MYALRTIGLLVIGAILAPIVVMAQTPTPAQAQTNAQISEPVPEDRQAFELTIDFDQVDPLEMVRRFNYNPQAWKFKGTKPTGKQTACYRLIPIGGADLDEIRETLPLIFGAIPSGLVLEAFREKYQRSDGKGQVAVADPSWAGPRGGRSFPLLEPFGDGWAPVLGHEDGSFCQHWRWIVECR